MYSISKKTKRTLCQFILFFFFTGLIPFHPVQPQAHAFSVGDEREVGEKLLSVVRQSFDIYEDLDIVEYINTLGKRILDVTGHQFFDYNFFIIKNPEFNAFAAPSGLVFIHSGLMEAMSNEGELVSVLAHECGHVTSRHISDRIEKSKKANILSAAMLIAGIAIGAGPITEALVTGSMAGSAAMSLKYSRQDEEEADRLAYKWMSNLDMDPAPMVSMLNKMHRESIYRTANIPPYLLTHPEPKRRMGYVQDLLAQSSHEKAYPPRDDFNFLRIKQRVISQVKSTSTMRAIFSRQAAKKDSMATQMSHYGLFLAHLGAADYKSAEESLRKVMDYFPDKNILKTDLAVLYYKSNRLHEAFELLQNAIQVEPDSAYTQYNLGFLHQKRSEPSKALFYYQKLLAKYPDHAKIRYNIGQLKSELGQEASSHYHLGYYFWLKGDKKNAKYHLNLAKDQAGDLPTKNLAESLLKKMKRIEKI